MAATITPESVWAHIPPRARDSHKGSFGAVLVVAGSACYRGAASLAVEGALRTGAGIVTLASVEPVLAAALRPSASSTALPEKPVSSFFTSVRVSAARAVLWAR